VRLNKRIFNNAQIGDHFAIIPTASEAKNLDDAEAKIYDLVARRFVAAFYPAADSMSRRGSVASQRTSSKLRAKSDVRRLAGSLWEECSG